MAEVTQQQETTMEANGVGNYRSHSILSTHTEGVIGENLGKRQCLDTGLETQCLRYIEPSPLKISTYTMVCNIINKAIGSAFKKIDLYTFSRVLPIHQPSAPECNTKTGCFLMIEKYTESGSTDMPRGLVSGRLASTVFNNQITLHYRYLDFRNINVKVFSNGKLQMTGIMDPDWETKHIAESIINCLMGFKYRVYSNVEALANVIAHDYAVVWNAGTKTCDWYRRNLEFYDLRILMTSGLKYDATASKWINSTAAKRVYSEYAATADTELTSLRATLDILLNKYDFTDEDKVGYIQLTERYKRLVKLDTKFATSTDFKTDITDAVYEYIDFFTNYKATLVKLQKSDDQFLGDVQSLHAAQIIVDMARAVSGQIACDFYEYATGLAKKENYEVNNIAIELINSDFNTRFNNNLLSIHHLLTEKYNLYSYYKPNCRYAGIILKFFYNDAYTDTSKYTPGRCNCATSCITKSGIKSCTKLTISIFRPGSIIITSAKSIRQLDFAYKFINTMLKSKFSRVSYQDASGIQRDHYKLNEDRKIIRKENKYYIARDKIVYPAAKKETAQSPQTVN